ncbi:MAG: alpha/beta hydrolase [Nitrospira sp.]|nr:alpha/beta hydrolase [Nitrospira sp.]
MADNIPVVYTDQGKGDTILILSTYPLKAEAWSELAGILSKSFRVIVAEPPWLTEPKAMGEDLSSEHILQVYRAFIRKLKLSEIHVIGVGEGGGLAVAFGHHFPEHIKTAISINGFEGVTWSDKTKDMLNAVFSPAEDGAIDLLKAASLRYRQDLAFREEFKRSLEPPKLQEQIKAVHDRMNAFSQDIKALYITSMDEYIDFPVMMIRSDEDAVLPEKYAEWSRNRIHGIQYQPLRNAGHFAFIDQPEKVAELITDFLLHHRDK